MRSRLYSGRGWDAWHSPVPYLFGGLAAMLGLIAFALLILACSYCRHHTHTEAEAEAARQQQQQQDEEDRRRRSKVGEISMMKGGPVVLEDKIVVIMAGHQIPSFLATPAIHPPPPPSITY